MKAKGLIPKRYGRVKVLARGYIDKPMRIEADAFSIDAIKGFGVPKEESIKKKPRKPKDPKIKLTPEFLTGEKGISLLLKKARKLNLKKNHPIVFIWIFHEK